MLDLVIKNAWIVDGTGARRYRGDVGVDAGRIASVGEVEESARRSIDASDLVVAPGFVDVHTHYDAQVMWDPNLSPSAIHGVTTVVAGNCGITLAPVGPGDEEFLTRLLARVEAIPLEALQSGLDYRWQSFAQFLDTVVQAAPSINVGFLVGHSALRRAVMAQEASEREASHGELEAMQELLSRSLAAGGLGFSSSTSPTQLDGSGRPTPPNFASAAELIGLARVCRDHPGTSVEFVPGSFFEGFTDDDLDLMAEMSLAADRHLNWNSVLLKRQDPELAFRQLRSADVAAARGGSVIPMLIPHNFGTRTDFVQADVGFRSVPGISYLFDLPVSRRIAELSDPGALARMEASIANMDSGPGLLLRESLERHVVSDVERPELGRYVGRSLADIAASEGCSPFVAACRLAVAAQLKVGFTRSMYPDGDETFNSFRAAVTADPRVMLGASDAGAHVASVFNVEYTSRSVAELVREHRLFELERLVWEFTEVPARLYGLLGRGRIEPGYAADLVIFDPESFASTGVTLVDDLPGGATRLLTRTTGLQATIVNGVEVVADGRFSGAQAGTVLRSGRDTATVTCAEARGIKGPGTVAPGEAAGRRR